MTGQHTHEGGHDVKPTDVVHHRLLDSLTEGIQTRNCDARPSIGRAICAQSNSRLIQLYGFAVTSARLLLLDYECLSSPEYGNT